MTRFNHYQVSVTPVFFLSACHDELFLSAGRVFKTFDKTFVTRENTGFPETVQIPCKIARQTTAEGQHGRGEALDDQDTEELLRLLRANPELAQLLRGLATRAPSANSAGCPGEADRPENDTATAAGESQTGRELRHGPPPGPVT
ncbi:MAG: hypothetical protein ACLQNE_20360 [Thermoguttaceae bacterium]